MEPVQLAGIGLLVAALFLYASQKPTTVEKVVIERQVPIQTKVVYQYPDHDVVRVAVDPNAIGGGPGMVYKQVGYLNADGQMLPLYGKPSYARRGRYYYYTIVNDIKVPVYLDSRDCMKEVACDEVYDGHEVVVPDYNPSIKWTVKLYENRYNF